MTRSSIRRLGLCAILFVSASAAPSAARAGGWCDYPYGYGGYGYLQYRLYAQESVPYFALHPPVYYSYPVAKPYGLSPFASPPVVLQPAAPPPSPVMVVNPYVASSRDEMDAAVKAVAKPLVIANPFAMAANPSVEPAARVAER